MTTDCLAQKKLRDVLTLLMSECDINDAELAKQTGIPLSTIARLRTNDEANPTAQTLRPLAKFFDITIGQLLGDEPFSNTRIPGTFNPQEYTSAMIPIIDWNEIKPWEENGDNFITAKKWISTEKKVSEKAFALNVLTDSLGLAFRKGSILIIDQNNTIHDGDLVLIRFNNEVDISLKLVLKDGDDLYAKSVNPELVGVKPINKECDVFGTVIECRYSTATNPERSEKSTLNFATNLGTVPSLSFKGS